MYMTQDGGKASDVIGVSGIERLTWSKEKEDAEGLDWLIFAGLQR